MKKLLLLLCTVGIVSFSNAQAIEDQAVIPVAVSLNSILRLNVTSGGNIEFIFNDINQYTNGITTSARYQTAFTVSSSVNFAVDLVTEGDLVGQENPGNTLSAGVLGIECNGTNANSTFPTDGTLTALVGGASTSIVTNNTGNAGDATVNTHVLEWNCGIAGLTSVSNQPADRYTTNCFLTVTQTP